MNKIKSRHIGILIVLLGMLFDGGYAKAERINSTAYGYTLLYYNQDHLGNIREVMNASGNLQQKTNYYPFGGIIADICAEQNIQPYKYNGKELDLMHGLNTYDYGARQYDPILARWDRMDPLCEKYYGISPYVYCADNPVKYIDEHGDSISIDQQSLMAIYNGLEDGSHVHMKFNNGVLDPSSISDVASSSNDTFLQDLYEIAINPQMVDLRITETNKYLMEGDMKVDSWGFPGDIDYAKEYNNGVPSDLYPAGKTIYGNLGQSLYPINSNELKKSSTSHIRININSKGTLNQRSCAIAHEFGHIVLYLRNMPHSHSGNADFIYERQWNVMKRLGYDYLESPTGKIFK